jgi:hypothetical protein
LGEDAQELVRAADQILLSFGGIPSHLKCVLFGVDRGQLALLGCRVDDEPQRRDERQENEHYKAKSEAGDKSTHNLPLENKSAPQNTGAFTTKAGIV